MIKLPKTHLGIFFTPSFRTSIDLLFRKILLFFLFPFSRTTPQYESHKLLVVPSIPRTLFPSYNFLLLFFITTSQVYYYPNKNFIFDQVSIFYTCIGTYKTSYSFCRNISGGSIPFTTVLELQKETPSRRRDGVFVGDRG